MEKNFSRRHYLAVASLLRDHNGRYRGLPNSAQRSDQLIDDFITLFVNDNPSFDPDRFRDACYKPAV